MKVGLLGLPNCGKTTVFNLLTGRDETVAGFGGKAAQLAAIRVPDQRVNRLSEVYKPRKTTFAEISFVDLAGVELGGGGLPSRYLGELKNLDAVVHVLRAFESETVPQSPSSGGAAADAAAMEQELILTDHLLIDSRLEKLRLDLQRGRREVGDELKLIERLAAVLESGRPLRGESFSGSERAILRGYQLLSLLPMILLANADDSFDPAEETALAEMAGGAGLDYLRLNAQIEWEISQLPDEERDEFLADIGVSEVARGRFIRHCYGLLDLVSFFTVGDDEVRAWTIDNGLSAVRAAGKIHSDFERGFIRAEVIDCERFFELGSMAEARKQGALRLEGKGYSVRDGDILTIRFNV